MGHLHTWDSSLLGRCLHTKDILTTSPRVLACNEPYMLRPLSGFPALLPIHRQVPRYRLQERKGLVVWHGNVAICVMTNATQREAMRLLARQRRHLHDD